MSDWESMPCDKHLHTLVVNHDTLEIPQSFVDFANPHCLPYCTIRVNSANCQLGLAFHDDPGDLAAQLIRECPISHLSLQCQTVSLHCRKVSGKHSWLDAVAAAPPIALRVFPLRYSAHDRLWVADLPYPLAHTVIDGQYPNSLHEETGVLCFFRGEEAIGVTAAPIAQYLQKRKVANSFWTACKYGVVEDSSRCTATAKWWRQFFESKQNASLSIQAGGNLRWRGKCRGEWDILTDQGWTEEAIESLILDAYREHGIEPNKVRSVAEQEARLFEGIECAALRSQLTPLEIQEAEKRYARRHLDKYYDPFDECYDPYREIDHSADTYLAEKDMMADHGEEGE